jgi:hypothetical protein
MKKPISNFIFVVCAFVGSSALADQPRVKAFDTRFLKAFLHFPLSGALSIQDAWIDIVQIKEHKLISLGRIALRQMTTSEDWDVSIDANRKLKIQLGKQGSSVTIFEQEIDQGWFPPAEICLSMSAGKVCQYELSLDADQNVLSLNILRPY